MQKQNITVLGLDISKLSASAWLLSQIPENPKRFARQYKQTSLKVSSEGRDALLSLDFDFAVLEPTGVYSRIWRHWLRHAGKNYRLVGHKELASYRNSWQLQKTDKLDGLAMAMYGLERCDRKSFWLVEKDYQLSDLTHYHWHLNRQKNGFINNLRSKLSWQIPEWYKRAIQRPYGSDRIPGILSYIAGESDKAKWQTEAAQSIGLGLSFESSSLARILIQIEQEEILTEQRILEELSKPQYAPYVEAAQQCGFSTRLTALLISCIYPLEQYLDDGRQRIIHHPTKERGKRVRKNESLRAFKLACGVGLIWHQSGDFQGWVAGGSGMTREALYTFAIATYRCSKKHGLNDPHLKVIKHGFDKQGIMKYARKKVEDYYYALYRAVAT